MKKKLSVRKIIFCTVFLVIFACGINFFSHHSAFVFDTPFLAVVSFVLATALLTSWLSIVPTRRIPPTIEAEEPLRAHLIRQSNAMFGSSMLALGLLAVIYYGFCIGEASRHDPLWLFFVFLAIWLIGCLFDLWLAFIRWTRKRD